MGHVPKAEEDASEVIRLRINGIDNHDWLVDHRSILHDYLRKKNGNPKAETDIYRRRVCQ
jgi:hypothetical protein